ncbi:hypothetical protein Tco_0093724 [Tanacetum coccineum]
MASTITDDKQFHPSMRIMRRVLLKDPAEICIRVRRLGEGKNGAAAGLLLLAASVVLDFFERSIVGRMKWDEALVDIASVTGRRLGRSGSGRLARKSLSGCRHYT